MSLHSRYIKTKQGGPLKTNVCFIRNDYLLKAKVKNPYTAKFVDIPLGYNTKDTLKPQDTLTGPNILDVMVKEKLKWHHRVKKTLFVDPVKRIKENQKRIENGQKPIDHPFQIGLCTVGLDMYMEVDDFVKIQKRSSVSIGNVIFNLACGMYGDSYKATSHIAELASELWDEELKRSLQLYNYIKGHKIADKDLPDKYRAISTISLKVETIILSDACRFFGISSDSSERVKGRPATGKNKFASDENSATGDYVFLGMDEAGHLIGRLIKDFDGWTTNTSFEKLTITQIAEIFVELKRKKFEDDANLIEQYLDLTEPNWKQKIYDSEDDSGSQGIDDPYYVFGIASDSSWSDIKKAYKKIINKIHPDKHADESTTGIAKIVLQAYAQLKEQHGK